MRTVNTNHYGCVVYDNNMVDIASGKSIYKRPIPTLVADNSRKFISPDGKYVLAIQEATNINPPSIALSKVGIENATLSHYVADLPGSKTVADQITAWSADSQYVAVGYAHQGVRILSIPDLRLAFSSATSDIRWSNSGHRFAYIDKQLIIATPDNPAEQRFDIPADYRVDSWSPTDEYLAFWGPNGRIDAINFVYQWQILNIQRQIFYSATSSYTHYGEDTIYPNTVELWSGDGRLWIYLTENKAGYTLMALHPDSGIYEALSRGEIERNNDVLNTVEISSDRRYIALRVVRNGKKALDIVKTADGSLSTLFSGEDRFLSGPAFAPGGSVVVAAMSSGNDKDANYRAHLVWANADGTGVNEFEETFTAVSSFRWLDSGNWIAYVVTRPDWNYGGGSGIEVANLQTAENHLLISGFTERTIGMYEWDQNGLGDVYRSPDGKTFLVKYGQTGNISDLSLDVVHLDDPRSVTYHTHFVGNVDWSADGSMFAFVGEYNPDFNKVIIADALGHEITHIWLPIGGYESTPVLFTDCG